MKLERYLPEHTTDDTIVVMRYYALKDRSDPIIQDLAHQITSDIHPSDKKSQMMAIMNWILVNMIYIHDEDEGRRLFGTDGDVELVKSPTATLESGRYDCDCIATFIASLMLALGIKPKFIVVGFSPDYMTGPDGYEHVYVTGFDDNSGRWIIIDPVSNPDEKQMILDTKQHKVYDIS